MPKKLFTLFFVITFCLLLTNDLWAQRRSRQQINSQPVSRSQRVSEQQTVSKSVPSQKPLTASNALSFALDPRSGEVKRAKGNHLIRRISLLESIPETKNLQIAFVVDGTDSMGLELSDVKKSVSEIVKKISELQASGQTITLSLVVYRDTGAESKGGEILIPSKEFTDNSTTFLETISNIKTVGGEPLFPESVDLGIYKAIHTLNWTMEETTERWIILIGDAPPFPEGTNRPQVGVRRSYPTDVLIKDANEKGIKINCIICSSGFVETDTPLQKQLLATYQELLPETIEFFNALYKGTKGCVFINLADELTQKTLIAAFGDPPQMKISPITVTDVETKQKDLQALMAKEQIGVAVLPFSFINQSDAKVTLKDSLPDDEFVAIAVPLQDSLKQIPSLAVQNFYEVMRYQTVSFSNSNSSTIQFNTTDVFKNFENVEWFIQGSVQKRDELNRIRLALVHRDDPDHPAAEFSYSGSIQPETPQFLFRNLISVLREKRPDANILKAYESLDESQNIWMPYGHDARACRRIAQAMLVMDNALGLFQDEAEYNQKVLNYIKQAENFLLSALELEPDNPYVHSLLANCYYNQIDQSSSVNQVINESEAMDQIQKKNAAMMQKVLEHIQKADANKEKCAHELIRKEIEADHALFNRNFDRAIEKYKELTTSWGNAKSQDIAIRAHWALAGIYAGDWGAEEKTNAESSREHILAVLAGGIGSQQYTYFTKMLEWDSEHGTQHPYVRRANYAFTSIAQ
jgi:tetratricopeptide (TPR) repeat protein